MVDPAEFAGQKPLVVGGSRGLGEVTAKLLASGGAHVTITFASGLPEAEAVQREIRDAGGKCEIINYDVRRPPNQQLDRDFTNYTHLYYFATPFIFRKKSETFSKSLFESFAAFYVYGFHELCRHLANVSRKLIVFYPSSVAVEMRPPLLTEYAMAKAAGEILCTDLKSEWPCIKGIWSRIPRIRTDQTATMSQVASEDPAVVLLPIIRKLNRAELLPPGINGFVWERA
jgi:NAD(P)-dependent dehydrogenase (short-subunit alcohol dehydrogenase family)